MAQFAPDRVTGKDYLSLRRNNLAPANHRKPIQLDTETGTDPVEQCSNPRMKQLWLQVRRVAKTDVTVLVGGDTGTGKEVVARRIHRYSNRSSGPFVAVNCASIPADLLESELFGHERGAFSGALERRIGRFERANHGTLFLDEIGDMPLPMQAKLLRTLQERCIERVGGREEIALNVRVVAATHCNLLDAVAAGTFREDLFYRLNVVPLRVPTLSERMEDLPFLLTSLSNALEKRDLEPPQLAPSALASLRAYPWPGNVRELGNLLEQLAVFHGGDRVERDDLPDEFQAAEETQSGRGEASGEPVLWRLQPPAEEIEPVLPPSGLNLMKYLQQREKCLIEQALAASDGVVSQAARLLKLRRTTLVEKIRKFDIQRDSAVSA
ncbi:MAG: sigma-54 dependent transcriptional regulator [Pseudomonadota bacterium]